MSRIQAPSSLKRKNPEPNALIDADLKVLNAIKSKKDMGIWARDIKRDTNLTEPTVKKSINSLIAKKLIKEVTNIQFKSRKQYIAAEFEPSKEITGGPWYNEGILDKESISELKVSCLKIIQHLKVATAEGIFHYYVQNYRGAKIKTRQQIGEILRSMVLDNEVLEVKSTGLGEYHEIPVNDICYRCRTGGLIGKAPKTGGMGSVPCGVCPRISQCSPGGIISPSTCVYFTKWVEFDF